MDYNARLFSPYEEHRIKIGLYPTDSQDIPEGVLKLAQNSLPALRNDLLPKGSS
jgi:hypothetical protein